MNLPFLLIFSLLSFGVIYCDRKYFMLRSNSTANKRPYSWSRVQLAFWTVIVLSSYASTIIWFKGHIPDFDSSTLYLLGISSATTAGATLVDLGDDANPAISTGGNVDGENFILDILSDKNGINIHRFQAVVFNFIFGAWFIYYVSQKLNVLPPPLPKGTSIDDYIKTVLPIISKNNLILMGLSSGTYVALKTTENKQPTLPEVQPKKVTDEAAVTNNSIIKG